MRGARVAPGIGTASVLGEFVVVIGRVYSYLRFSDPRQAAGHSLDRQAAYAARWAAEHGLVLDESLSLKDEGLSAYHQRHVTSGALGVFLAAVQGGQVPPGSVLVVEALDRLSRAEPIQAQAQLAQIVNAGITVVTASDGKSYSRETLKANIGKTFGNATIEDFLADKGIGPKRGDAYLVNFGNPQHSKYILCEDLITEQGGQ